MSSEEQSPIRLGERITVEWGAHIPDENQKYHTLIVTYIDSATIEFTFRTSSKQYDVVSIQLTEDGFIPDEFTDQFATLSIEPTGKDTYVEAFGIRENTYLFYPYDNVLYYVLSVDASYTDSMIVRNEATNEVKTIYFFRRGAPQFFTTRFPPIEYSSLKDIPKEVWDSVEQTIIIKRKMNDMMESEPGTVDVVEIIEAKEDEVQDVTLMTYKPEAKKAYGWEKQSRDMKTLYKRLVQTPHWIDTSVDQTKHLVDMFTPKGNGVVFSTPLRNKIRISTPFSRGLITGTRQLFSHDDSLVNNTTIISATDYLSTIKDIDSMMKEKTRALDVRDMTLVQKNVSSFFEDVVSKERSSSSSSTALKVPPTDSDEYIPVFVHDPANVPRYEAIVCQYEKQGKKWEWIDSQRDIKHAYHTHVSRKRGLTLREVSLNVEQLWNEVNESSHLIQSAVPQTLTTTDNKSHFNTPVSIESPDKTIATIAKMSSKKSLSGLTPSSAHASVEQVLSSVDYIDMKHVSVYQSAFDKYTNVVKRNASNQSTWTDNVTWKEHHDKPISVLRPHVWNSDALEEELVQFYSLPYFNFSTSLIEMNHFDGLAFYSCMLAKDQIQHQQRILEKTLQELQEITLADDVGKRLTGKSVSKAYTGICDKYNIAKRYRSKDALLQDEKKDIKWDKVFDHAYKDKLTKYQSKYATESIEDLRKIIQTDVSKRYSTFTPAKKSELVESILQGGRTVAKGDLALLTTPARIELYRRKEDNTWKIVPLHGLMSEDDICFLRHMPDKKTSTYRDLWKRFFGDKACMYDRIRQLCISRKAQDHETELMNYIEQETAIQSIQEYVLSIDREVDILEKKIGECHEARQKKVDEKEKMEQQKIDIVSKDPLQEKKGISRGFMAQFRRQWYANIASYTSLYDLFIQHKGTYDPETYTYEDKKVPSAERIPKTIELKMMYHVDKDNEGTYAKELFPHLVATDDGLVDKRSGITLFPATLMSGVEFDENDKPIVQFAPMASRGTGDSPIDRDVLSSREKMMYDIMVSYAYAFGFLWNPSDLQHAMNMLARYFKEHAEKIKKLQRSRNDSDKKKLLLFYRELLIQGMALCLLFVQTAVPMYTQTKSKRFSFFTYPVDISKSAADENAFYQNMMRSSFLGAVSFPDDHFNEAFRLIQKYSYEKLYGAVMKSLASPVFRGTVAARVQIKSDTIAYAKSRTFDHHRETMRPFVPSKGDVQKMVSGALTVSSRLRLLYALQSHQNVNIGKESAASHSCCLAPVNQQFDEYFQTMEKQEEDDKEHIYPSYHSLRNKRSSLGVETYLVDYEPKEHIFAGHTRIEKDEAYRMLFKLAENADVTATNTKIQSLLTQLRQPSNREIWNTTESSDFIISQLKEKGITLSSSLYGDVMFAYMSHLAHGAVNVDEPHGIDEAHRLLPDVLAWLDDHIDKASSMDSIVDIVKQCHVFLEDSNDLIPYKSFDEVFPHVLMDSMCSITDVHGALVQSVDHTLIQLQQLESGTFIRGRKQSYIEKYFVKHHGFVLRHGVDIANTLLHSYANIEDYYEYVQKQAKGSRPLFQSMMIWMKQWIQVTRTLCHHSTNEPIKMINQCWTLYMMGIYIWCYHINNFRESSEITSFCKKLMNDVIVADMRRRINYVCKPKDELNDAIRVIQEKEKQDVIDAMNVMDREERYNMIRERQLALGHFGKNFTEYGDEQYSLHANMIIREIDDSDIFEADQEQNEVERYEAQEAYDVRGAEDEDED